ncbi:hypothetical protein FOZ61_007634 [Perkinsus olseni]|uniref:Uncharacterized protein n=1 Tax=Perkinsus olseni TaxID=32597 RepID=A0A7J6KUC6_PEROL|nr:hypothetical protein FOL46_000880 [Perkinsus olseni]KAF4655352.1 hypothetical protein FOZ61_007634 [Perkinsus olseni]
MGSTSSEPLRIPAMDEPSSRIPEHPHIGAIRTLFNQGGLAASCDSVNFKWVDGDWRHNLEKDGIRIIGMVAPGGTDELRLLMRYHKEHNVGIVLINSDRVMIDSTKLVAGQMTVACSIAMVAHYVRLCRDKLGRQIVRVGSVTPQSAIYDGLTSFGVQRCSLNSDDPLAINFLQAGGDSRGLQCTPSNPNSGIFRRFCDRNCHPFITSDANELLGVVIEMYYEVGKPTPESLMRESNHVGDGQVCANGKRRDTSISPSPSSLKS